MLRSVARTVVRPRTVSPVVNAVRYENTSSSAKPGESTPAEQAMREHSETVSGALSKKQDRDVVTAEVVSGAPIELLHRSVRIYKPTDNTMQSGGTGARGWRLDWDTLPGSGRWENRLMGWASSADYMQGTRLRFRTKEEAAQYAEKQGWDYYVQEEPVKRIPPKAYAENYVHIPGKLRIARTK